MSATCGQRIGTAQVDVRHGAALTIDPAVEALLSGAAPKPTNDVANLLNSSEVATIFLGNHLQIKRFTPSATNIVPLVHTDLGRPITHFSSNLRYEHLERDVREVLEKLASKEVDVETIAGQWYRLRIVPYRTLDNFIGGVVLTFVDITHLKHLQAELQSALAFAENVLDSMPLPIVVLDSNLQVVSVNQAFRRTYTPESEGVSERAVFTLDGGQWNLGEVRPLLEGVLSNSQEINDYQFERSFPQLGQRQIKLQARRLVNGGASAPQILLTLEDVTQLRD